MDSLEKIQGKKRIDIFRALIKERVLVKTRIRHEKYELLTMISGLRSQNGSVYFVIDTSESFDEIIKNNDQLNISFEFTLKENMQYAFRTSGVMHAGQELWIELPEWIERIQRRGDFRLGVSSDIKFHFDINSDHQEMKLINLSMGGALTEFLLTENGNKKAPVFNVGDHLEKIVLSVPMEKNGQTVFIKKALVVRVNSLEKKKGLMLGLKFVDMDNQELSALKDIIYDFQREFLQRRLKTDL